MGKRGGKEATKQIKTTSRKTKVSSESAKGSYRTKRLYPDYSYVLDGRTIVLSSDLKKRPSQR